MQVFDWIVWGFLATVLLEVILTGSQAIGLTRISMPFVLGTMLTSNRDKARALGLVLHALTGWVFSLGYIAVFIAWGAAGVWRGALVGLVHALAVLGPGMKFLPSVHPRMASEEQGPTPVRQLEPPGFLATHYGWSTPASVILAHIVYGAVLGGFYRLHG